MAIYETSFLFVYKLFMAYNSFRADKHRCIHTHGCNTKILSVSVTNAVISIFGFRGKSEFRVNSADCSKEL